MGADISGFVEICKYVPADGPKQWGAVVRLRELVERNYGMFGALFGVRNNDGFTPAFAGRGLPADCSATTAIEAYEADGGVEPSWALWSELRALDWDAIGSRTNSRNMAPEQWEQERHNPAFIITATTETPEGLAVRRTRKDHPEIGEEKITPGRGRILSPTGDDLYYSRVARYMVREVISLGWQACFDVMRVLAGTYGDENVRLIAWFDSK